jgi:hypothetical protein
MSGMGPKGPERAILVQIVESPEWIALDVDQIEEDKRHPCPYSGGVRRHNPDQIAVANQFIGGSRVIQIVVTFPY